MKTKLIGLLLFFCLNLFGQVPNTNTFLFSNVCNAVYGSYSVGMNLTGAFAASNAAAFDPTYGSKTMTPQTLLGFRNYGAGGAFNTWYLPTRAEEQLMYDNLGPSGSHNFSNDYYWSSEECVPPLATYAWSRTWVNGTEEQISKATQDHVRPIRAFTSVSPSYSIGDVGPAGGWIFYVSGNNYKEALNSDLWEECTWANAITTSNNLITY